MTQIAFRIEQGPRENIEDAGQAITLKPCAAYESEISVMVVADGVGGAAGGEVASATAAWWVTAHLAASLAGEIPDGVPGPTSERILALLRKAIEHANQAIVQQAAVNPELNSMATTVVSAVIAHGVLHVAWLGDSRCYLFSNGTLHRITRDHSDTQDLLDAGAIIPAEAVDHPCAHVINRYVGRDGPLDVETRLQPLMPHDSILMCTDGLTDVVSDDEIATLFEDCLDRQRSIEVLPERLIDRALKSGTQDNVSVMCCHYQPQEHCPSGLQDQTVTGSYPVERARALRQLQES